MSDLDLIPCCDLWRLEENAIYGTFGALLINQQVFCCTLEPADELNAVNQSCIPAQQYMCKRYQSPTFGKTFKITDVPGRSQILFHPGNVIENTAGCVLLGQSYGRLGNRRAILNSGITFEKFMEIMQNVKKFKLTIHHVW